MGWLKGLNNKLFYDLGDSRMFRVGLSTIQLENTF